MCDLGVQMLSAGPVEMAEGEEEEVAHEDDDLASNVHISVSSHFHSFRFANV